MKTFNVHNTALLCFFSALIFRKWDYLCISSCLAGLMALTLVCFVVLMTPGLSVMYDHTFFLTCQSLDQTSGHT